MNLFICAKHVSRCTRICVGSLVSFIFLLSVHRKMTQSYKKGLTVTFALKPSSCFRYLLADYRTLYLYFYLYLRRLWLFSRSCTSGDVFLHSIPPSHERYTVVTNITNIGLRTFFYKMGSRRIETAKSRNFITKWPFVIPYRWKKQNTPQQMKAE